MAQVSGYFQIIAVKDGEDVESWSIEASVPLHLDGYNVQLNPLTFYVDHKKGSSSQRVRAYFTIRYFTASFEAGNDVIQAETDNLIYTYPADKYGYATNLKVEAYSDSKRKNKITERVFDIIRDNPVYKARIELWKDILIFKHGEFILLNNKVYMWDYPIAGNSKISPELDRTQNKQNKPYKQDGKTHWILYENYDLIATNILFSQYALLGGAVMTGRMNADTGLYDYAKMFSQTGQDGTTDYEKFDPSKDAWERSQSWTPTLCLDFLKGTTYQQKGVVGGFDINGYELTNKRKNIDSNGNVTYEYNPVVISVKEGSKTGTDTKTAALGNVWPSVVGVETAAYMSATGTNENIALTLNAKGSTYSYFYGGKGNLCIYANGGVKWNMAADDFWCMPGVLKAAVINRLNIVQGKPFEKEWGNGCHLSGYVRSDVGVYRINHNIGHTDYVVMAIASTQSIQQPDGAWLIVTISELAEDHFIVIATDVNNGLQDPRRLYFTIVGRPGKNV